MIGTEAEKKRVIQLAEGVIPPETGIEKHFVNVCNGKGRACTPQEKEWVAYWQEYVLHQKEAVCHTVTTCKMCGKPIPRERLQAIPHAQRCVLCQDKFEHGEADEEEEVIFCEKCGAPMVWRVRTSVLPTKYFLGCSNYPKCKHILAGTW